MSKILIAYFSRKGNNFSSGKIVFLPVGNTEVVAKKIQAITGGDLFEIQAAEPYPEDYRECTVISRQEMLQNARPTLLDVPADLSGYDTLYLGYPNWCGTCPMPVFSFLEQYDFAGKTIRPFGTNEGSGLANSERDIKAQCPAALVGAGLSIIGHTVNEADAAIEQWLGEK